MRNYKLLIAYDGTRYQGWQRQMNTTNTIQWILEWTIGKMVGYQVRVHGSGRTDAGVHAFGQAAHVQLAGQVDTDDFRHRLNIQLPEDIQVWDMQLKPNSFHARKQAQGKCYEYYIDRRRKPDVFTRQYCYHFPHPLDVGAMQEAAALLVGKHNFASFTDNKDITDTVRIIYNIQVFEEGDKLKIRFYGNGFLYHMVRILTGTLLEMGTGEKYPSQIPVIVAARERALAGFLAPARGLFLRKVYYDKN